MTITRVQYNQNAGYALQKAHTASKNAEQKLSVINAASNGNSVDALKMQNSGMVATNTKSSNLTQEFFSQSENKAQDIGNLNTNAYVSIGAVREAKFQFAQLLAKAQGYELDFKQAQAQENAKNELKLDSISTQALELGGKLTNVEQITLSQLAPSNAQSIVTNSLKQDPNLAHQAIDNKNNYKLADLFLDFRLNTLKGVNANSDNLDANTQALKQNLNNDDKVDLEALTLDFSSMLPLGTQQFLQDLNCSQKDKNQCINLMVFGTEQGPQGQKASDYFSENSMSLGELKTKLDELLAQAKVNVANLNGEDYNLVALPNGSDVAQVLAQNGVNLHARTINHQIDTTFKHDMANMQVLASTSNREASLF